MTNSYDFISISFEILIVFGSYIWFQIKRKMASRMVKVKIKSNRCQKGQDNDKLHWIEVNGVN